MITAIDHIALAVRDLDVVIDGYRKMLGREPNWIGGDGGARHAWFQFPNMALDIIMPHGEGAFGDRMDGGAEGRVTFSFPAGDWLCLGLDTQLPGAVGGSLGADQVAWIRRELAEHRPRAAVLPTRRGSGRSSWR